jgi:glycosyltransferase involved in cell wall biosynthesis
MRVIFVNRYFFPDQSATSRMVSSIAFALAQRGLKVEVVASRSLHNDHATLLPADETVGGVRVKRLNTSRFGRQSVPGRMIDYLFFHLLSFLWLLRNARKGDAVTICTDPPLLSCTSAIALRLRGAHMVNWIMDLFPETALELGYLGRRRLLGQAATALRDWSIRKSALIICPTKKMADYMKKRRLPGERVAVLHHWSNEDEIYPLERSMNGLRAEWGLKDKFLVGYSGNFGRAHEFGTLIEAAARLKSEDDICFLMIGGGHQHGAIMAEVAERQLKNVIFKPLQPVARLAESLGAADVHIVSLLPELEYCIVPSKFYGILAAGRPTLFIGDDDGEVARVVSAHGCGERVAIGDTQKLVSAILAMRDDRVACLEMGRRARRLTMTVYARQAAIEAWQTHLQDLDQPAGLSCGHAMERHMS